MNMEDIHYNKYIKYKTKYLKLKELSGGDCEFLPHSISNKYDYTISDIGVIGENTKNGIRGKGYMRKYNK